VLKSEEKKNLVNLTFPILKCYTFVVQKVVWLKRFFEHLDIATNSKDPMIIYCDSWVTITYTMNPKYYSKAKHIDIKYNFVRDIVTNREITLQYIPTGEMIDDLLITFMYCKMTWLL